MAYILDLIIIAICVVCFMWGSKKGFVRTIFKILSFLLAGILTFMLFNPFYTAVSQTKICKEVSIGITQGIHKLLGVDAVKELDSKPRQEQALGELKVPEFLWDSVLKNANNAVNDAKKSTADAMSAALSEIVIKLACGILLFLLIKFGLSIIMYLIEGIMQLPVLNVINKLMGGVAGIINGILISYIICAVLALLTTANYMTFLNPYIEKSYLFKYLYNNNFLGLFMFK